MATRRRPPVRLASRLPAQRLWRQIISEHQGRTHRPALPRAADRGKEAQEHPAENSLHPLSSITDRPQRVVRPNPTLKIDIGEQLSRPPVRTPHRHLAPVTPAAIENHVVGASATEFFNNLLEEYEDVDPQHPLVH
jgi:hypothetical protein